MDTSEARHGITRVEVLAVVIVLAIIVAMLLPAIRSAVAASRRANCRNHLMQIGLGLQNYNSAFGRFPGSAALSSKGATKTVHGWSFLVEILPYLEYGTLYGTLDPHGEPDDASDPAAVAALSTTIQELQCPSNPNRRFVDPRARPLQAFTNYKAMGATCISSLEVLVGGKDPPYCPKGVAPSKIHPDGALYPGPGITVADIVDGTARTIQVVETIDDVSSRWTVGKEVTLVGLPNKVVRGAVNTGGYSFFHPIWLDDTFNAAAAAAQDPLTRPYIAYDFSPGGKDAGTYEDTGIFGQAVAPAYGPSSGHGGIVNHLFGDGSVLSVSARIDPCAYWFLITKNGGDPYHPDPP
jgi:type II secretory pathway pseudopilin PulG